jgi:hypothetical protein
MSEDDNNIDIDVESVNLECYIIDENEYDGDNNNINDNFIPSQDKKV